MTKILVLLKIVLLLGIMQNAAAAEVDLKALKQTISEKIGYEVTELNPTPVANVYEIVVGAEVAYVTGDGRFMLIGNLFDLNDNRKNLTEAKKGEARIKLVNSVPSDSMIVFEAENVEHTITVFTDTDCGYCRKLHSEIPKLNDLGISVRYMAFPRAGRNSQTYNNMVSVWCSQDPHKAMTEAKKGAPVEPKRCQHPIDEHLQIVQQLGLSGTPATIFEDGTLLPGYLPAKQLKQRLNSAKAQSAKR